PAEPTADARADDRPATSVAKPEADSPSSDASKVKAPVAQAPESPSSAPAQAPASTVRPGTIDVAATRAAARAQLGPVQQGCERAKMEDTSLAGTVTARITVAPDGSVSRVDIAKSTLGAPQVDACIRQGILRWRLQPPSGGVAASLTYPLIFE